MSAAVRHVSIRVPWHDRAWDGHVCDNPLSNTSCLALKLIAEGRHDAVEANNAGEAFDKLSYETVPPCIKASAAFLSPVGHTFQSVMSYSTWSKAHSHMKPRDLHLPAYGAQIIPYRWMLRETGFELAKDYDLGIDPENEPTEPAFLQNTDWVQHHDHQRSLLEAFARPLIEEQSIVFFYATRTPLCDDERRVLVGAAVLTTKHGLFEYEPGAACDLGQLRAMVWERSIQHSLRTRKAPDGTRGFINGFVLPYQAILKASDSNQEINPSDYVAFAPQDAREQFSYGSEHVSHGVGAAALLAAKEAFERIKKVLDGPWDQQIEWIDTQIARLWKLSGPAPGLGVVLAGWQKGFNGTLFAIAIGEELKPNEDPWPLVDAILSGKRPAPKGSPDITAMMRRKWQKTRADVKAFDRLRLLARFELSKKQAARAMELDSAELLSNPYLLYERDRIEDEPIAFEAIDRGLLPGSEVIAAHPLPPSCAKDLKEYDNDRRLRAVTVHLLEQAAAKGDTVVSADRLSKAAANLTLAQQLPLDADILDLCRDDFAPVVAVGAPDTGPTAQLDRYVDYGRLISDTVRNRLGATRSPKEVDWAGLLEKKFGPVANGDHVEELARKEKLTALNALALHKISVLTGPAGTGKTAVLEVLLRRGDIVGPRVVLLAPTGKARVRLGEETGRPGDAKTVAQFLLQLERYDGTTGRYFSNAGSARAEVTTCIIDECSMLTEDMLAAILDALSPNCRLILVGDPNQLPPIGAGCPFVDIIASLQKHHPEHVAALSGALRQKGIDRADVQLGAVFAGRPLGAGEDEIAHQVLSGVETDNLKLRRWENVADLPGVLRDIFKLEFGGPSDEDLVGPFERSLGATQNEKGYWNFNNGSSASASNWQILSVNRNQPGGSIFLNRGIKENYRSRRLDDSINSNQVAYYRPWFRTIKPQGPEQITYGDKVICVRNHRRDGYVYAEKRKSEKDYIANGETGLVVGEAFYGARKPNFANVEFSGREDRSFGFSGSAFKEDGSPTLELAYAVTVHKAQGSQFGVVILVLPANSRLLSREMIYTALTRQKDRIWIVHQGGMERLLAYRHPAFSDIEARTTNLLRQSDPRPVPPPSHLPAGLAQNMRGFLDEKLIHRTIRGEAVSSKSELAIANILYALEQQGHLTYEVEPGLPFSDNAWGRWADFRITANGETWYWEHCGRLDLPKYRQRWAAKQALYAANGFSRWSPLSTAGRLIVTEDGPAAGLDSHEIDKMARQLFSA